MQTETNHPNIQLSGPTLFFDTDPELFLELKKRNPENQFIRWVKPGKEFDQAGDAVTVRPGAGKDIEKLVQGLEGSCHIIHFWSREPVRLAADGINRHLNHGLYTLFQLTRHLSRLKPKVSVRLIYAFFDESNQIHPLDGAVGAFAKTVQQEISGFTYKTVAFGPSDAENGQMLDKLLFELRPDSDGIEIRYRNNQRYVRQLEEIRLEETGAETESPAREAAEEESGLRDSKALLRDNGVYLLTGGAGGLGFVFSEYLATRYHARLVLSGRSPISPATRSRIKELEGLGARAVYVQADVSVQKDVAALVVECEKAFGTLHGIIHAAGVIRDALITKKTPEDVEAVVAPKVFGPVHLDEATRNASLDFMVLFSSTTAIVGNPGQCDYAYGNSFMDYFAQWRENQSTLGNRSGKTLAINWPLWKEGGMGVDEQTEQLLSRTLGIRLLEKEAGLAAFQKGLGSDRTRIMVAEGEPQKMKKVLGVSARPPKKQAAPASKKEINGDLKSRVKDELGGMISEILAIDPADLDLDEDLSEYGFDSISFTSFANKINETYDLDLTPAIFFEYATLDDFIAYFCDEYQGTLVKMYGTETGRHDGESEPGGFSRDEPAVETRFRDVETSAAFRIPDKQAGEDIAVIGIHGVMPLSENPMAFWENLAAGRDLISEIPKERWDWSAYYGDPAKEVNRTNVKWGGFIRDVDCFDAAFFGISPREAELMDPQQRIYLETVWKTIEDAGYKASDLAGTRTGVFVGVATRDYLNLLNEYHVPLEAHTSTGASHSILANRISFLLDLHGHSEAIDTACSSSLVAIERAVASIKNGTCRLAIAGGINLMLTPDLFISFSKAGLLCEDGRCKSFDKRANGYARGEGAGAVLLKPLAAARRDGDYIHAVIKSCAVNHGGHVNTLTAPNPNALAQVLVDAYQKAGIDPATVGYIECHGTGTKLGDPIEINGLKKAFHDLLPDGLPQQATCGVGSVKTNIGHLETAAGIASVLKVILSMKHGKIPGNLHFEELNPYIHLDDSPFYIVRETREWKRIPDQNGTPLPRRASVNSFGFGGTNAHVVFEEYPLEDSRATPSRVDRLIVLSARNADRIDAYVKAMITYLTAHGPELRISDVAYTMQTGREEMEERLAVIASSIEDLIQRLHEVAKGTSEKIFRGTVNPDKKIHLHPEQSPDLPELAKQWVVGARVDWRRLHPDSGRRIPLPTYPFERKRYWVPKPGKNGTVPERWSALLTGETGIRSSYGAAPHPLIGRNVSDLSEQKYELELTGHEFFIKDHVVNGEGVFPGVAYLEMARAGGALAAKAGVAKIRNVVWVSPIRPASSPERIPPIQMVLYPNQGAVDYEVRTLNGEGRPVTHSQGQLVLENDTGGGEKELIDLEAIRSKCPNRKTGDECYQIFESGGLRYGPCFRTIEELRHGDTEALALLRLPSLRKKDFQEYLLDPSMLDGALQSAVGLLADHDQSAYLPFAMGEVVVCGPVKETCFAYATVANSISRDPSVKEFDICLADESGEVLVKLHRFSVQATASRSKMSPDMSGAPPETLPEALTGDPGDRIETLYYHPCWEKADPLPHEENRPDAGPVLVITEDRRIADGLKSSLPDPVIWLKPGDDSLNQLEKTEDHEQLSNIIVFQGADRDRTNPEALSHYLNHTFYPVFHLVRRLMKARSKRNIKLLYAFENGTNDPVRFPVDAGISGLLKTVSLENTRFLCKSVEIKTPVDPGPANEQNTRNTDDGSESLRLLLLESRHWTPHQPEVRYEGNARYVKRLKAFHPEGPLDAEAILLERKTYVITGGMGGLGYLFATELAKRFKAKLVLVGRSELTPGKKEKIRALETLGAETRYVRADVSRKTEVAEVVKKAKARFHDIHGVIHAAGVISDAFIHNKTTEQITRVLDPKIYGTVNLDELLKDEPLDFFVMFSSTAATFGNVGQCDYAFGNGFMDAFAATREDLRANGHRRGKSLSINWPLWKHGGMSVDRETEKHLFETLGVCPLETDAGVQALLKGLTVPFVQFLVLCGMRRKLLESLSNQVSSQPVERTGDRAAGAGMDPESVRLKLIHDLKANASMILKVDEADIQTDMGLSDFGFDSITLTELCNQINDNYGLTLLPSVFFEYPTIDALQDCLLTAHGDAVMRRFEGASAGKDVPGDHRPAAPQPVTPVAPVRPKQRFYHMEGGKPIRQQGHVAVAVIGMAGAMPQSDNLDLFWKHLDEGRDLISEIPSDRWDWQTYWGDPAKESGKTRVKWGGFMNAVDRFDPLFFGISPREAEIMDPQQRLYLQTVWETIEDAGYSTLDLAGKNIALFAGVSSLDYNVLLKEANIEIQAQTSTGIAHSILVNRISYLLDFHGPSEPVDTACSSSLVAIHRAVESIRNEDCEAAIAGGVNVMASPTLFISFDKAGMLSPDGRCKTFDKDANGYARGEGTGAVFLKPLHRAEADGDHIYGVIRGSAVNHGGQASSLTAPNPGAQADVLVRAWEKAGIDPATVTYIEAHGTGTGLGDPVEITGLKKAFQTLYAKWDRPVPGQPHCGLGSVKTNIGHLEAAAGIAGVLKVLLALKHQRIPASLHLKALNPYIQLTDSPFYIATRSRPWPALDPSTPRRAGVSAFGFGGVNAHVVIEEYPRREPAREVKQDRLIVLSAKNRERLQAYAKTMAKALHRTDRRDPSLEEIAHTLQTGRVAMEERLAMVVSDKSSLAEKLGQLAESFDQKPTGVVAGNVKAQEAATQLLISGRPGKEFIKAVLAENDLAKLAQLWVAGVDIDWKLLYDPPPARVALPAYPFERQRHWIRLNQSKTGVAHPPIPAEDHDREESKAIDESSADVTDVLLGIVSGTTGISRDQLDSGAAWTDIGVDSIQSMKIIEKIDERFQLRLFPNEFSTYDTVQTLADHIVGEIESNARPPESEPESSGAPGAPKPVVYLLSTPRAGSTLLRVMLMGHSDLFAPPELHLLPFTSLKPRKEKLVASNQAFFREGLIETIGELQGLGTEDAVRQAEQMEEADWTVAATYRYLQERTNGRFLVDKSPTYAAEKRTLERAEEMGPDSHYIFLIRHPLSVMASFVHNRFAQMLGVNPKEDPWEFASRLWYRHNINIKEFLSTIPEERRILIRYEDLVEHPDQTMQAVCGWLKIPFEEAMLNLREGNRMTGGLYQKGSIGDPNFDKRTAIEPALANAWDRHRDKMEKMDARTIRLAREFGYPVDIRKPYALSPPQHAYLKHHGDDPRFFIVQRFRFPSDMSWDAERFKRSLGSVIKRHAVFRTQFLKNGDGWMQIERDPGDFPMVYEDLSQLDASARDARIQEIEGELGNHVRMDSALLPACAVISLGKDQHQVLVLVHHLVADGVTMGLFHQGWMEYYRNSRKEAAVQECGYEDFVDALLRVEENREHMPDREFWEKQIAGAKMKVPQDLAGGPNVVASERGSEYNYAYADINLNGRNPGGRLFNRLSTGLYQTLSEWTGQADPIVAHRLHRRYLNPNHQYPEAAGWFAGDIPLRFQPDRFESTQARIEAFQQQFRDIPMGGMSYEMLAMQGVVPWVHAVSPVRLNVQPENTAMNGLGVETHLFMPPDHDRHYLMDLIVRMHPDRFILFVRYSSHFHRPETIETFVEKWMAQTRALSSSG